jgi:hypothetical protein
LPRRVSSVFWRSAALTQTFAELGRQVGVDGRIVRHVFDDYMDRMNRTVHFETPEILGVDELKIIGQYRAIKDGGRPWKQALIKRSIQSWIGRQGYVNTKNLTPLACYANRESEGQFLPRAFWIIGLMCKQRRLKRATISLRKGQSTAFPKDNKQDLSLHSALNIVIQSS